MVVGECVRVCVCMCVTHYMSALYKLIQVERTKLCWKWARDFHGRGTKRAFMALRLYAKCGACVCALHVEEKERVHEIRPNGYGSKRTVSHR